MGLGSRVWEAYLAYLGFRARLEFAFFWGGEKGEGFRV